MSRGLSYSFVPLRAPLLSMVAPRRIHHKPNMGQGQRLASARSFSYDLIMLSRNTCAACRSRWNRNARSSASPPAAVRALNEDAERRFDASIASFRRLTPQEANDVHGLKIAVVTAAPGDTIDTLAARMVTPNRPVEYFLLLNELDPGAAIIPGEHYKIGTE